MDILLWIWNIKAFIFKRSVDLLIQPEMYRPVIARSYPRPHSNIYRTVSQLLEC
jgi:hypothetical protein